MKQYFFLVVSFSVYFNGVFSLHIQEVPLEVHESQSMTAEALLKKAKENFHAKNFTDGIDYLQKAADQSENLYLRASALLYLGEVHYFGRGIEQNFVKAKEFFECIIKQDSNQKSKIFAKLYLSDIYLNGLGTAQNISRSIFFLEQVARQRKSLKAKRSAEFHLAKLLLYGSNKTNYQYRALHLLKKCERQTEDIKIKRKSTKELGQVHFSLLPVNQSNTNLLLYAYE